MTTRSEVLFLGGRSGVGKSSVGNDIHVQLSDAEVWHCLIEGDNLDLAYPPPWEHGLAPATWPRRGPTTGHSATGGWSTRTP